MFWGKTIVYIDNSNIYRGGKDAGWLPEYEKLMRFLETLGGQLWDVHFFAIEESSSERTSTSDFFDYLQKGLGFKLHLYTYGFKSIRCVHCGRFSQVTIEKGLDVGISTQIMRDYHNNAFDTLILMSANRDYIEMLDFVSAAGKKVKLLIWRNTMSQELLDFTNKWGIEVIYLDNHRHDLEKSRITRPDEPIVRPAESVKTDYISRDEYRKREGMAYQSSSKEDTFDDQEVDSKSYPESVEMPKTSDHIQKDNQMQDEGTPLN